MVSETLQALSKAERELERMADNGERHDQSDATMNEMRNITEKAILSGARTDEEWGREAMTRAKENIIDEEVIL